MRFSGLHTFSRNVPEHLFKVYFIPFDIANLREVLAAVNIVYWRALSLLYLIGLAGQKAWQ